MARLKALSPDEATGKTKELFTAIEGKLGMVPNMMRTMGNSSAVLEGYLNLSGALDNVTLGAKIGELIALAVAESNSCDYCLSAHTYIGTVLVHIDSETLQNARTGTSSDAKITAMFNARPKIDIGMNPTSNTNYTKTIPTGMNISNFNTVYFFCQTFSQFGIMEVIHHFQLPIALF